MGGIDSEDRPPAARLGMGDAVSLMIGIVIGASIYETPPDILSHVSGPWAGLGVWALGGLLSLAGALCYAELASTYPRLGGDYVYLSRAFGPWMGFLFGWGQLAVVRTANIGMMAFVFARYALRLWDLPADRAYPCAAAAVVVLTVLNVFGVVFEKWTQNVLSVAKVVGLAGIVVAGFCCGRPGEFAAAPANPAPDFGLALIFVLYAYGGWNDAAFVAAELRQRRDIPRSLLFGIAVITLIYLAVNAAYLLGLGFDGVRSSEAVAAELLARPLGDLGAKAMCILVMISALGSIHGTIFAGTRLYAPLGTEHRVFSWLGRLDSRHRSPVWALLIQALISLTMIAAVGTETGQQVIDRGMRALGREPLPWSQYKGGFGTLLAGTNPVFWGFFLLTGIALFVLRRKDRTITRPFALAAPAYPLVPLVFCGTCLFMLYAALAHAKYLALIGIVPLCVGVPLYFVPAGKQPRQSGPAEELAATARET